MTTCPTSATFIKLTPTQNIHLHIIPLTVRKAVLLLLLLLVMTRQNKRHSAVKQIWFCATVNTRLPTFTTNNLFVFFPSASPLSHPPYPLSLAVWSSSSRVQLSARSLSSGWRWDSSEDCVPSLCWPWLPSPPPGQKQVGLPMQWENGERRLRQRTTVFRPPVSCQTFKSNVLMCQHLFFKGVDALRHIRPLNVVSIISAAEACFRQPHDVKNRHCLTSRLVK